MKTLEEILAPLEEERGRALELFEAVPDLIAVRDGLRKVQEDWIKNGDIGDFVCAVDALVGWPPANPKPAAEEPRT